jgi:hypothetical protein
VNPGNHFLFLPLLVDTRGQYSIARHLMPLIALQYFLEGIGHLDNNFPFLLMVVYLLLLLLLAVGSLPRVLFHVLFYRP